MLDEEIHTSANTLSLWCDNSSVISYVVPDRKDSPTFYFIFSSFSRFNVYCGPTWYFSPSSIIQKPPPLSSGNPTHFPEIIPIQLSSPPLPFHISPPHLTHFPLPPSNSLSSTPTLSLTEPCRTRPTITSHPPRTQHYSRCGGGDIVPRWK